MEEQPKTRREKKNEYMRQYRIDKEQNMATTDMYQCRKCKERKCKVSSFQTRSADEPATVFICCVICKNTWTI
jgi:transcription elongation factor S-II